MQCIRSLSGSTILFQVYRRIYQYMIIISGKHDIPWIGGICASKKATGICASKKATGTELCPDNPVQVRHP